jgi:hypothetical protein
MKRHKPMNRAGKRTREWERIRAKLKARFTVAGITRCEFKLEGCAYYNFLGFAHTDKRRFLKGQELENAALACNPCHAILELLPRDKMKTEIESVIRGRERQP